MPRPDYSLLIGPNWLHMWPRVTAERHRDVTHTHSPTHTFTHLRSIHFSCKHTFKGACPHQMHLEALPGVTCMHTQSNTLVKHQNIYSSKELYLMFFMGLLCWQTLVQYSKMTAAPLKIIVKKLKPLGANARKPHVTKPSSKK